MTGGIRQFDYNHKVDKLVSTHPLGDFICVRCKRNALKLAQKDNQIGSKMHVLGMIVDDDGARMGAGVASHEQRKHPLKSATLSSTL